MITLALDMPPFLLLPFTYMLCIYVLCRAPLISTQHLR